MPDTGSLQGGFGDKYTYGQLIRQNEAFEPLSDVYSYVKGRMFDRWIDSNSGSSRSNGKNANDLIASPPYIIESLLRDELYVERDLTINEVLSTTSFIADPVASGVNDFYNYAVIRNVTTGAKSYVTDYTGASYTFVINDADASMANGNKFILSNVACDTRINIASFDDLGNTTNGKRKDWLMAQSIYRENDLASIISTILYESFCFMFKSFNQYKIVALDTATSGDTWTNPLKIDGREYVFGRLSTLDEVYTDFTLNYYFDDATQSYLKSVVVNPKTYTTGLTDGSTLQTTCQTAKTNYKVNRRFIYNSDWIKDTTTAGYLITKFVNWYTKQRLMITWAGDIQTYVKYEIGDQVKLNYANLIPDALNNSAYFMIMGKEIVIRRGSPYVIFQLVQMT